MATNSASSASGNKNKLKLSLDLRIVSLVLLASIIAMLLIWKPWSTPDVTNRTIQVTGEAKVTATPDEYVFYPSYEFKNSDKAIALSDLSKKSDEIVTNLKSLGVDNNKIKTNSDGNNLNYYKPDSNDTTYNLQLTITVNTKVLAQKVQDYLITTSPQGTISPVANFSNAMQKTLESKARDDAAKEARAKAEQSAQNLGFKVGKVKSISDGAGFNGSIMPMNASAASGTMSMDKATTSLAVHPGQNDLNYSVTVTYYIH